MLNISFFRTVFHGSIAILPGWSRQAHRALLDATNSDPIVLGDRFDHQELSNIHQTISSSEPIDLLDFKTSSFEIYAICAVLILFSITVFLMGLSFLNDSWPLSILAWLFALSMLALGSLIAPFNILRISSAVTDCESTRTSSILGTQIYSRKSNDRVCVYLWSETAFNSNSNAAIIFGSSLSSRSIVFTNRKAALMFLKLWNYTE